MSKFVRVAYAACLLALTACGQSAYNLGKVIDAVVGDSIAADLYLIGDAGLPAPKEEPVLQALEAAIRSDPQRTVVVYLGDNVYPSGVPDSADVYRAESERILNAQIEVLRRTRARGIFIPGNHDWDAGGPQGLADLDRQQRWIAQRGEGTTSLLPTDGCPGPEIVDIGNVLRILVLDTQWWLHEARKPAGTTSPCASKSENDVLIAIQVAIRDAGPRKVVVVGHHPLYSGGEHGGYFDWPSYLFPFHPWARIGGAFANQDFSGRQYRRMRDLLTGAFVRYPPLVYAAGHEHNLQVFRRGSARYSLVSGAGIYGHTTAVRATTGSQYVRRASGFMRVTFLTNGRVRLAVIVVDAQGKTSEDFSMWLESSPAPN